MSDHFRLTLAQLNPTVGDLGGNAAKARAAWAAARDAGAQMVALPEMFITGYQTQDLVMKPAFYRDAMAQIEALAVACADGPIIGVGGPFFEAGRLYNAYHILRGGKVIARTFKHELPNYNVFDEVRHYTSGPIQGPFDAGALRIGTPICEDAWFPDVAEAMAESGAEMLLVANGSPYFREKFGIRMNQMVARVTENALPLVYLNMVGGQDDQVFDGGSFVLNRGGRLAVQLPVFDEAVVHVDFRIGAQGWEAVEGERGIAPPSIEQDYRAMVLSLKDYLHKTGFSKVLLGLSGGIDSALVAVIAADALGPANVRCVMLPSEYTARVSLEDAAEVAANLGVHLDTVGIAGPRAAVSEALSDLFAGRSPDLTEENIQSRLRGLLLMAQSNKFGEMLLTTGNKSEVAVGYATIYGDMAGGYNPIKDLYKTRVFATCRWRNDTHRDWMAGPPGMVIPSRVIDKPPSAELRPDQRDDDSLPPYDILDGILELLVDGDAAVADCVLAGYDRTTVKKVEHLIYISEYKRFQSAPGTRLTRRAFWLDRRYPIANRWRDSSCVGDHMAETKTKPTEVSVADFLAAVDPAKRADALALDALFRRVTGFTPRMWGPSMVGYGRYDYIYDSGHSGSSMATGFSPRKAEHSIYVLAGYARQGDQLARLGKHRAGKSCLYVKRLSEIDLGVLETMIGLGLADLGSRWPIHPE